MNIPNEIFDFDITILFLVIAVAWPIVIFFTKDGRKFRSSRNKKARKQI